MTSTVNETTRHLFATTSYDIISTTAGLTAIVLLVVLLVEKEVLRTSRRTGQVRSLRALDVAILPLLFSFTFVVAMRFAVDVLHFR
ncbi:MAG TPA: hypothetical protein VKX16_03830 [Chloroflexota bacterium]|nr:hypothetical protein [Chloroflexota bacterium]